MTELGYDERATNFSTTNTTVFATTGAGGADPIIGGLQVDYTGTGDPVMVEFYAPGMGHATHATATSYFVVNGAVTAALSQHRNWATTQAEGGVMRRRMVLTDGVAYTFQVGMAGRAAGITTVHGQTVYGGVGAGVMHLRVTD